MAIIPHNSEADVEKKTNKCFMRRIQPMDI